MTPGLIACAGVFVVLTIWGMWSDLTTLSIPDTVSIGLTLAFLAAAQLAGVPLAGIATHLGIGAVVFVLGALLFFLGAFGGGDVKMLAAVAVWAGWPLVLTYIIWVALLGGLLAGILLIYRRLPDVVSGDGWAKRLHRRDGGIPYGLAIGVAGLVLLTRITWWQLKL